MFDLLGKLMLTDLVCLFTCMLVIAILREEAKEKNKHIQFAYDSAGLLGVFYLFMIPILLIAMIWFA